MAVIGIFTLIRLLCIDHVDKALVVCSYLFIRRVDFVFTGKGFHHILSSFQFSS